MSISMYCVANKMRYYGKGIVYAVTCQVEKADKQRELFKRAATLVPRSRVDFPNRIINILPVAAAMLDGEIEYRRGNYGTAFNELHDAISLEDAIPFAEPWGWLLPARHAYTALSLEQGHVEQSAQAYAQNLGLQLTPRQSHFYFRIIFVTGSILWSY